MHKMLTTAMRPIQIPVCALGDQAQRKAGNRETGPGRSSNLRETEGEVLTERDAPGI